MSAVLLKEIQRALEAMDVEAVVELYDDEFAFDDPAAGLSITDKAVLRDYFEQLFSMPGVRFTDVTVFGEAPGMAAGGWVWSGVDRGGAHKFAIKGASIFELSEFSITKETVYYDPRPALAGVSD